MERHIALRPSGPPPLIPIFPIDIPSRPSIDPTCSNHGINHESLQPDYPFSMEDEENNAIHQQWRFSIHQHKEDKVVTLLDGVVMPNDEEKRYGNPQANVSKNVEEMPNNHHSNRWGPMTYVEECLTNDRLQFLYEDPLFLQELVFQEKCRASSNEIDLNVYHTSQRYCQLVTFCRLRRIYHAGLLSIRLDSKKSLVLVTSPADAYRFARTSTEIRQISSDWTNVPQIVTELLSTLDVTGDHTRYTLLLYNSMLGCWELIACLDSSSMNIEPSQISPEPNPLDFLMLNMQEEDETQQELKFLNHSDSNDLTPNPSPNQIVEEKCDAVVENPMLNKQLCYPSLDENRKEESDFNKDKDLLNHSFSTTSPPSADTPSVQSPLFSCPAFIFPSLAILFFSTPPSSPVKENSDSVPPLATTQPENTNFKCEICNKVFTRKVGLKKHKKIHDPSKWEHCILCDFKTPYAPTLRKHIKKAHDVTAQ